MNNKDYNQFLKTLNERSAILRKKILNVNKTYKEEKGIYLNRYEVYMCSVLKKIGYKKNEALKTSRKLVKRAEDLSQSIGQHIENTIDSFEYALNGKTEKLKKYQSITIEELEIGTLKKLSKAKKIEVLIMNKTEVIKGSSEEGFSPLSILARELEYASNEHVDFITEKFKGIKKWLKKIIEKTIKKIIFKMEVRKVNKVHNSDFSVFWRNVSIKIPLDEETKKRLKNESRNMKPSDRESETGKIIQMDKWIRELRKIEKLAKVDMKKHSTIIIELVCKYKLHYGKKCKTPFSYGSWAKILISSTFEYMFDKINYTQYYKKEEGEEILANFLGFDNASDLLEWASVNKKLWDNDYGHEMFLSNRAFGIENNKKLTIKHIADHLEGVMYRNIETLNLSKKDELLLFRYGVILNRKQGELKIERVA